jgi:hypothetical protein
VTSIMPSGGGRLAVVKGVEDLVEHAYGLRHEDAATAVAAASAAVDLAERSRVRSPRDRDLRAHAWGVLGNSLRIAGQLVDAHRALDVAEWHRHVGSGAVPLQIEGARFRASLAVAEGQHGLASLELGRARDAADRIGDTLEGARCRIKLALVACYKGDLGEARVLAADALEGAAQDLDLLRSGLEILMASLALDERPLEALQILVASREAFEGAGELINLKLRWVRGLVAAQILGRLDGLREVQESYAERGMGREAGLVALDIAVCAANLGSFEVARKQLQDAQPILAAYGINAALTQAVYGEVAALRRLRTSLSAARMMT